MITVLLVALGLHLGVLIVGMMILWQRIVELEERVQGNMRRISTAVAERDEIAATVLHNGRCVREALQAVERLDKRGNE